MLRRGFLRGSCVPVCPVRPLPELRVERRRTQPNPSSPAPACRSTAERGLAPIEPRNPAGTACPASDSAGVRHADRLARVTTDPDADARPPHVQLPRAGRNVHRGGARAGSRGAQPALAVGAQRRRGARRRGRRPVGCRDDRDRELDRRRRLDRAGRPRDDARPADRRGVPRPGRLRARRPPRHDARGRLAHRRAPRRLRAVPAVAHQDPPRARAHPRVEQRRQRRRPPRRHERCGCRDLAARHPRASRARPARREDRRQPRGGHAVRARRPHGRPARADRRRQDLAHRGAARRPPRCPARDARAVRDARHQPVAARVAPDRRRARAGTGS